MWLCLADICTCGMHLTNQTNASSFFSTASFCLNAVTRGSENLRWWGLKSEIQAFKMARWLSFIYSLMSGISKPKILRFYGIKWTRFSYFSTTCVWTVGGSWRNKHREHMQTPHSRPGDLNHEPSSCEATVCLSTPLLHVMTAEPDPNYKCSNDY